MIPSLTKAVKTFERNVDKFTTYGQIARVLKSVAELEKRSTNHTFFARELDHFYDVCMGLMKDKVHQVKTLQGLGDIIVSFAKVGYYPEDIMDTLKSKVIDLFLSERIERKNSEVFKAIVDASKKIEEIKKLTAKQENEVARIDKSKPNQKVQELADLRQKLRTMEIEIASQIAGFLYGTNSVFEMEKLISGLSAFTVLLKENSAEFLDEFYNILLSSLTEVHQNQVVMEYFVKNTRIVKLVLIMQ